MPVPAITADARHLTDAQLRAVLRHYFRQYRDEERAASERLEHLERAELVRIFGGVVRRATGGQLGHSGGADPGMGHDSRAS